MKKWHNILKKPLPYYLSGLLFLLVFAGNSCIAQTFAFSDGRNRDFLDFELIKNLIVIPLYVNGEGPYNFILDTGVGPLIVSDRSLLDTVNLQEMRTMKIYGLGVGDGIDAYISNSLDIKIAGASIQHIPSAILKEDIFNLSAYVGKKIYGLIGFSFFSSFVVKVNYSEKRITFTLPEAKMARRGIKFPIQIENKRPYLITDMQIANQENIKVKLIVDCGASHALSMAAYKGEAFPIPKTTIKANLGIGLSGPIEGSVGRIPLLKLGKLKFKNILSSFPSFESVGAKIGYKNQDGNLGAELLRRFIVTYDYPNSAIYLKPNSNYRNSFEHDMSGMEIYTNPNGDNRFFIGRIEPDSPANTAGFLERDEILSINLKEIELYTLDEINNLFKSGDRRTIVFEISRNNKNIIKLLQLRRRI